MSEIDDIASKATDLILTLTYENEILKALNANFDEQNCTFNAENETLKAYLSAKSIGLEKMQESLSDYAGRLKASETSYQTLYATFSRSSEEMTEALATAIREGVLDRDDANNIADNAGVDHPKGRYTVTVMVEITIEGIEANSADDAEDIASGMTEISCNDSDVEFAFDITDVSASED